MPSLEGQRGATFTERQTKVSSKSRDASPTSIAQSQKARLAFHDLGSKLCIDTKLTIDLAVTPDVIEYMNTQLTSYMDIKL